MSNSPVLSIVMSVFNGEKTVEGSINSILRQTWKDFEFIIIDDASTDLTSNLIKKYTDPRIKLIVNSRNLGLPASLNKAVEMANGTYIGRMDADDISMPERFSAQIEFMEKNQNVGVCGTWVFGPGRFFKPLWKYPCNHEEIKALLLFESCLAHPTVLFRKSAFGKNELRYNENYRKGQDYELWGRVVHNVRFATIPKTLLHYHPQHVNPTYGVDSKIKLVRDRFVEKSGFELTSEEKELHHRICTMSRNSATIDKVLEAEAYLKKLLAVNEIKEFFDKTAFKKVVAHRWYKVCYAAIKNGIPLLQCYFGSFLRNKQLFTKEEGILFLRAILRR